MFTGILGLPLYKENHAMPPRWKMYLMQHNATGLESGLESVYDELNAPYVGSSLGLEQSLYLSLHVHTFLF